MTKTTDLPSPALPEILAQHLISDSRPARPSRSRTGSGIRESGSTTSPASPPCSRSRSRPYAVDPGGNLDDQQANPKATHIGAVPETPARPRRPRVPGHATEVALPDGRIEISSGRSRRKILIEPGTSNSPRGRLLRVSGHPFSMNSTLNTRFGARWDPATRTWTVSASQGLALRAYLFEHF